MSVFYWDPLTMGDAPNRKRLSKTRSRAQPKSQAADTGSSWAKLRICWTRACISLLVMVGDGDMPAGFYWEKHSIVAYAWAGVRGSVFYWDAFTWERLEWATATLWRAGRILLRLRRFSSALKQCSSCYGGQTAIKEPYFSINCHKFMLKFLIKWQMRLFQWFFCGF